MAEPLGVHEFRAAVSDLLDRFREDPHAAPIVVGAYRRAEAVLLPIEQYQRLQAHVPDAEHRPDHPDLPAIRAQLARSPEERLDGLCAAADFFAAARPVS